MPQVFQVICCYQCKTFQVHQIKKVTKWICKMCGEKQSLKKVYGTGTGKECRILVQDLNEQTFFNNNLIEISVTTSIVPENSISCDKIARKQNNVKSRSKWEEYETSSESEPEDIHCKEISSNYVFERMKANKRVKKECDRIPKQNLTKNEYCLLEVNTSDNKNLKNYAINSDDNLKVTNELKYKNSSYETKQTTVLEKYTKWNQFLEDNEENINEPFANTKSLFDSNDVDLNFDL